MNFSTLDVYALSVVVLFAKFFGVICVQAVERLRRRSFRYAEDAAFWGGVVGDDSERCVRAQQLLRNDGESQVWYLALAGAYTAQGAWETAAPFYFGTYTVARLAHAYFFLTAKQPHRNRAFSLGIGIQFALAAHVIYASVQAAIGG